MSEQSSKQSKQILFWLAAALAAWIWCFRHFLSGDLAFTSDAVSYYNHIKYFIDELMRGNYPLWNPYFSKGVTNEFFLRRFGSFNPFYSVIIFLRFCGLPHLQAYTSFLAGYWFFGAVGFYVIARSLLKNQRSAFVGFLLFYFSALSTRLFDSYILLVLIPMIWFFALLIRFFQTQKPVYFIGLTLSLMILATTYIPLYFGVILFVLGFLFGLIYPDRLPQLLKIKFQFMNQHKWTTALCAIALVCSLVPGIQIYMQAGAGDFVMPIRANAVEEGHTFEVGKGTVTSWAMLEEFVYASAYSDLTKFKFAVVYFPCFMFMIFFLGLFLKFSRGLLFCFLSVVAFFLIGTPGLTGVYDTLYAYVPIFHLFRNLHWFLWLAIFPLSIFFVAQQFDQLQQIKFEKKYFRVVYVLFILAVHGLFYIGIQKFSVVLPSTSVSVGVSLFFWLAVSFQFLKMPRFLIYSVLFLVAVWQPIEVYGYLAKNSSKIASEYRFNLPYYTYTFERKDLFASSSSDKLYYALKPYNETHKQVDHEILYKYTSNGFYVYDSVFLIDEEKENFLWEKVEDTMARNLNMAVVQAEKRYFPDFNTAVNTQQAQRIREDTKNFKLLAFESNKIEFETNFTKDKFFVLVNTFNKGWEAVLNENMTPIYQANGAFQGLVLPAGKNHVTLRFGDHGLLLWNLLLYALYYFMFILVLVSAIFPRVYERKN